MTPASNEPQTTEDVHHFQAGKHLQHIPTKGCPHFQAGKQMPHIPTEGCPQRCEEPLERRSMPTRISLLKTPYYISRNKRSPSPRVARREKPSFESNFVARRKNKNSRTPQLGVSVLGPPRGARDFRVALQFPLAEALGATREKIFY